MSVSYIVAKKYASQEGIGVVVIQEVVNARRMRESYCTHPVCVCLSVCLSVCVCLLPLQRSHTMRVRQNWLTDVFFAARKRF